MPRRSPPRQKSSRVPASPAEFQDTPRLISSDEKRELILAHAASRSPQDPLQRMSFWAGIAVAVAVIVGGWWTTVGWQVRQSIGHGGEDLKEVTKRLNEFTEQVDSNPMFKNAPALDGPTAEAVASELSDRMKAALNASSTERESDLMAPSAPGAPTSSDAAASPAPQFPIDPTSPGLTPDS